jgi:single-stranded-DNA-specific exonuclease
LPWQGLRGIEQATQLLEQALREQRRILIVGDYDADGATSCAVAIRGLHAMGASEVQYLVPSRFDYGYGLSPELADLACSYHPDLLVTVDNGISSIEGVARARAHGIQVLITDHHLPGAELPQADAILNPNQPDDHFASKHLCGVGVMFYLLMALRVRLRDSGWFADRTEPNLASLLDLVALGTVADVVQLDRNNRILVSQGLARIRAGRCQPGILALLEVAGRQRANLAASDLGFFLGPRLNAAGRLEDMSVGIECLISDDPLRCRQLAAELHALNQQRRQIEAEMQQQALTTLDALNLDTDDMPYGLCLHRSEWHEGVIGILASRIKDRLHRPVIIFADAQDGQVKGSARSVSGVHIRDVLEAVATRHPGLIRKFGGHAMAAGLSMDADNLPVFMQAFDQEVRAHLCAEDLTGLFLTDGELAEADIGLPLADSLRRAGPWGQGFQEPLFEGEFLIDSSRILAEKHLKLRLKSPAGRVHEAIAFNTTDADWPAGTRQLSLVYRLEVNSFRDQQTAQLNIVHLQVL